MVSNPRSTTSMTLLDESANLLKSARMEKIGNIKHRQLFLIHLVGTQNFPEN